MISVESRSLLVCKSSYCCCTETAISGSLPPVGYSWYAYSAYLLLRSVEAVWIVVIIFQTYAYLGENHPLMAEIDGNIGVILYAVQEFDDALKFLQSALKLHHIYLEPQALKTALIYHLMARTYSCRGDFRTALQMEKVLFSRILNSSSSYRF